jgi:hypothetical protein
MLVASVSEGKELKLQVCELTHFLNEIPALPKM